MRVECSIMQASEKPAHFQNSAERRGERTHGPIQFKMIAMSVRESESRNNRVRSCKLIEAARMRTLSIASGSGKLAERAKNVLGFHALAEIGIDKSCLNDAIAPY